MLGTLEEAEFSAIPTLHFRTQGVLGRKAEVQFDPQAVSWDFSDGQDALGSALSRSFSQSGSYWARAKVRYQVSFRLVGETTWQQAGSISVYSNLLEIIVSEGSFSRGEGPIVLVGQDCLENPGSYGCTD